MKNNNDSYTEPKFKVTTEKPTLKEAQKFVGGFVEMITLDNGDQVLVNEEGLLQGLEVNPSASLLTGRRIVGDALVLSGEGVWT